MVLTTPIYVPRSGRGGLRLGIAAVLALASAAIEAAMLIVDLLEGLRV